MPMGDFGFNNDNFFNRGVGGGSTVGVVNTPQQQQVSMQQPPQQQQQQPPQPQQTPQQQPPLQGINYISSLLCIITTAVFQILF